MRRGLLPQMPDVAVGAVFGCLSVVGAPRRMLTQSRWIVPVRCKCGDESDIIWSSLRKYTLTKCRCANRRAAAARMKILRLSPQERHAKHGYHGTPTYISW